MSRCLVGSSQGRSAGHTESGSGKAFPEHERPVIESVLRLAMGFGPQHVFHSIRKTVVTALENAGVAENVVADIVGHEKLTMTYGLYSGGLSLAVKRDALAKLTY